MSSRYFLWVAKAAVSASSSKKTLQASAMVVRFALASGGGGTAGVGSALPQVPAASQAAAIALASSHSHLPVVSRRPIPESVPDANMGQKHFLKPLRRSSNSLERKSFGCLLYSCACDAGRQER